MSVYDPLYAPAAPVAWVSLRNPEGGASIVHF